MGPVYGLRAENTGPLQGFMLTCTSPAALAHLLRAKDLGGSCNSSSRCAAQSEQSSRMLETIRSTRPASVVSSADSWCEPGANISATMRRYARVTSLDRIPSVCGALVPVATLRARVSLPGT